MEKKMYKVGDIVTGFVTGIEKYGIFVNLDNCYSGLIHISEISNSFVRNIDDYAFIGETIKVRVLEVDSQHYHLKLSIKNLDYRADSSKTKKNKIIETKHGFSTLDYMLKVWINSKKKSFVLKK